MNYAALRYAIEVAPVEGAAWQVLVVIAYRADRHTGEACMSRRRLAREARVSLSTVHDVLGRLLEQGVLGIVLAGSGRRAVTYQVLGSDSPTDSPESGSDSAAVLLQSPSDSLTESVDNPVVSRLAPRSDSIRDPVVSRSPDSPYKERREERKGLEGSITNGAAPPSPSPSGDDSATPRTPTRCRHRNDPATCGICSAAVGSPPPRADIQRALRVVPDQEAEQA